PRTLILFASVATFAIGCSAASRDSSTDESDLGTCPSGQHECTDWGATCSGSTLRTCVVGPDGCRKLLQQTCTLGCDANACKTCDALRSPLASKATSASPAYYRDIVRRGTVAFATWTGRDGIYTESPVGLTTIDLSNPAAVTTIATKTLPSI